MQYIYRHIQILQRDFVNLVFTVCFHCSMPKGEKWAIMGLPLCVGVFVSKISGELLNKF